MKILDANIIHVHLDESRWMKILDEVIIHD
jgi:hypothetical protein